MMRAIFFVLLFGTHSVDAQTTAKDIVVVGGALTEIVYALGAEHRIAATDTTSMYPEAALKLPKVGYARTLSAEGVLSMRPKVLLGTGEAGPPAVMAQIKGAGVRVEIFSSEHSMQSVIARIDGVARAIEMPKEGAALVKKMRQDWDATRDKVAGYTSKPRVLFLLAHAGPTPQISGEGTAAHAMIEFAGGENAIKGFTGYRSMTAESVIAAKPDVVLISSAGLDALGAADDVWKKPGLALTPAGTNKRMVVMNTLLLLGFGPRTPQAVDELAGAIRKP